MTFTAVDVLAALLDQGHSVRRDNDRIMIAPTERLDDEDRAAIKATRAGILDLLRVLEWWQRLEAEPEPRDPFADESIKAWTPAEWAQMPAAISYWRAHNGDKHS